MSMAKTILWNTALIFIALSYGSYNGDGCYYKEDDICPYWHAVTLGTFMASWLCMYLGGIAVVLLALTSEVTQTILATDFFQFFGRISYTLYLIHELIIFWPENDFVREMTESGGMKYKLAVFIAFCIFTPVLVLVSWILLILVDDPFKNFAYEIDIVWRKTRPPTKNLTAEQAEVQKREDDNDFGKFIKNSMKFFGLVMYFICLYVITESYSAYSNKESDVNYNTD